MKLMLATFFTAVTLPCLADLPIMQDELVRRTQELYDAVVPDNQAPWKKYFADDCIFADEKGRLFDKPKLIADITPLPAGYSGTIKIENAQTRFRSEQIFRRRLHLRRRERTPFRQTEADCRHHTAAGRIFRND